MAKQSGLHQIRGKVGEHSYYKQAGVNVGLIRSINQGMSARVKTSEEYANTRLNNAEFGAAANVAGLLGKMVVPKFRPMILPFSQSRMAKLILEVAKQNVGNWGQRTVSTLDTARLAAILSAQSKRDPLEFVSMSAVRSASTAVDYIVGYSDEQATLLSSLGVNKLRVSLTVFNLATGIYHAPLGAITTGYLEVDYSETPMDSVSVVSGHGFTVNDQATVTDFIPAPNHVGHQILVFIIMPIRTINSVDHILQEYCSFKAFDVNPTD